MRRKGDIDHHLQEESFFTPLTLQLLPSLESAYEWFQKNTQEYIAVALATNQGGVGLRYWMETEGFGEPEKFPTEQEVYDKIEHVIEQLPKPLHPTIRAYTYISFAYQSKKSGKWGATPPESKHTDRWFKHWRKPNCGMLQAAMLDCVITPSRTLMVGDRPEDEEAAKNARVDFTWADDFFGRNSE